MTENDLKQLAAYGAQFAAADDKTDRTVTPDEQAVLTVLRKYGPLTIAAMQYDSFFGVSKLNVSDIITALNKRVLVRWHMHTNEYTAIGTDNDTLTDERVSLYPCKVMAISEIPADDDTERLTPLAENVNPGSQVEHPFYGLGFVVGINEHDGAIMNFPYRKGEIPGGTIVPIGELTLFPANPYGVGDDVLWQDWKYRVIRVDKFFCWLSDEPFRTAGENVSRQRIRHDFLSKAAAPDDLVWRQAAIIKEREQEIDRLRGYIRRLETENNLLVRDRDNWKRIAEEAMDREGKRE